MALNNEHVFKFYRWRAFCAGRLKRLMSQEFHYKWAQDEKDRQKESLKQ